MELTRNDEESERIQDLHSYRVLDTDPEVTYDQLTYIAAQVCETPISLLSFVDTDRQWFKSTYGLDLHELPRHITACNETIKRNDLYEIKDSSDSDCPYSDYMSKLGFRFYAGVPIISKHGHKMGSLCVIDFVPRELTHEQIHVLKVISGQIVDLMELRRQYEINLQELQHISEVSYKKHGHLQDIAHKASIRAMAELSTGLIYRIRPLTISTAKASERLEDDYAGEKDLDIELNVIQQSSENILSILSSLERFIAAEKEKWMKPLDLSEVIRTVVNLLEYKIKKFDITMDVNANMNVMCIGNISQITEAVYAIVNNAIEAVQNLDTRKIKILLQEENHTAAIFISDTGKGISDAIKPFIFQPFFTTKRDENLGVGLSLAQALIQQHSGDVELVKSYNPTIFKISIPVP